MELVFFDRMKNRPVVICFPKVVYFSNLISLSVFFNLVLSSNCECQSLDEFLEIV